jgi:hypothetical protein
MDSDSLDLDRRNARKIIDQIGGSGQPPSYGIEFFSVGLEEYLSVIDEEYLSTFIKDGGASFKMVVGVYGGGKTHFLYSIRDLAWKHNFAVSYVSLKSSGECPFHQLDLVYKAIVNGLVAPLPLEELAEGYEAGISAFLKTWYGRKFQDYQTQGYSESDIRQAILGELRQLETSSVSFAHAIRAALTAYLGNDIPAFEVVCQWLKGEGFDKRSLSRYQVLQKIDKSTAFQMIRSLGQSITHLGYAGLIILLDEAERVPSLSRKQQEQHLSNLREIIDECGHPTFNGIMLFYAVPDANFLDGRTMVYEALKQRVSTTFTTLNPTGIRIELEKAVPEPIPFLQEVGRKLSKVYETAYSCDLNPSKCKILIEQIADWAHEQRFNDEGYKRLFVQKLVQGLRFLQIKGEVPSLDEIG